MLKDTATNNSRDEEAVGSRAANNGDSWSHVADNHRAPSGRRRGNKCVGPPQPFVDPDPNFRMDGCRGRKLSSAPHVLERRRSGPQTPLCAFGLFADTSKKGKHDGTTTSTSAAAWGFAGMKGFAANGGITNSEGSVVSGMGAALSPREGAALASSASRGSVFTPSLPSSTSQSARGLGSGSSRGRAAQANSQRQQQQQRDAIRIAPLSPMPLLVSQSTPSIPPTAKGASHRGPHTLMHALTMPSGGDGVSAEAASWAGGGREEEGAAYPPSKQQQQRQRSGPIPAPPPAQPYFLHDPSTVGMGAVRRAARGAVNKERAAVPTVPEAALLPPSPRGSAAAAPPVAAAVAALIASQRGMVVLRPSVLHAPTTITAAAGAPTSVAAASFSSPLAQPLLVERNARASGSYQGAYATPYPSSVANGSTTVVARRRGSALAEAPRPIAVPYAPYDLRHHWLPEVDTAAGGGSCRGRLRDGLSSSASARLPSVHTACLGSEGGASARPPFTAAAAALIECACGRGIGDLPIPSSKDSGAANANFLGDHHASRVAVVSDSQCVCGAVTGGRRRAALAKARRDLSALRYEAEQQQQQWQQQREGGEEALLSRMVAHEMANGNGDGVGTADGDCDAEAPLTAGSRPFAEDGDVDHRVTRRGAAAPNPSGMFGIYGGAVPAAEEDSSAFSIRNNAPRSQQHECVSAAIAGNVAWERESYRQMWGL